MDIEQEIGIWKCSLIVNTNRIPGQNITRQALQWNKQDRRVRGWPWKTWRSKVEKQMKTLQFNWIELGKRVQERDYWKLLVNGLYPDLPQNLNEYEKKM